MVECGIRSIPAIIYLILFIYLPLSKPGHPVCTLCLTDGRGRAPTPAATVPPPFLALAVPKRLSSSPGCVYECTPFLSGPLLYGRIAAH